jgi:Zn-dependent alcohol dehydrogenase
MKTRAAVLRKAGTPWEITELELDPPKANEVLIRMEAAGLCHSDEHIRARGAGRLPALVSCGVTTGFCSAIYAGDVRVGDTVVVFGTGGVGMNAVQRAAYAGAKFVVAIDPNPYKLDRAPEFGATHTFADPVKAKEVIIDLTRGQLADKVICTVGEMDNDVVKAAVDMTGKAGTIVITGVGYYDMVLPGGILIGYHRRMQGSLFGGANPLYDIPMILSLWHEGKIKLTELITKQYTLDEINEGYQDLMDGKNIRGVIVHQH